MNKRVFLHSLIDNRTPAKSLSSWSFVLPLVLAGIGCGDASSVDSLASAEQALGGVSVVASFDPTLGQLPESVTIDDDGNFYLSMGNTVQRLKNGQLSLFAQLPIPASASAGGVKFGPDGNLYVTSSAFDPTLDASNVFRVSARGQVTQVAHLDATGFPNDLAFDDDGNIFVTDPFLAQLWKIDRRGRSSVWLKDPLLAGNAANPAIPVHAFGADGIAFDKDKSNLYVGNLDQGAIVRIPVGRSGDPGRPRNFVVDARLRGADGIAFDKKGNLFVAVNTQDQLAKVEGNGRVSVLSQGSPLDGTSSLVFGAKRENRGDDQDCRGSGHNTLYIANFAISRAFGLQPGTPHPSLASIPVEFAGQAIP